MPPPRADTSATLEWIQHDVAHLAIVLPKIHATYRAQSPSGDGLRSPAPGGARQIGTHADPTYSASQQRPDPNDPLATVARIRTQLVFLAKLSRTLVDEAAALGYPAPPMPACADCGRRTTNLEGGRCPADARAHRRTQQRQLDVVRGQRTRP